MREKQPYVVVTFYTTAEAMATKKICQEKGIEGKLFSAPRALSADCGIAWRSDASLAPTLRQALTAAQIEVAGYHEIEL